MAMNESTRIQWWMNLCKNNTWLQQFGQTNDSFSFDGKTGCGFCVLQTLILGWKKIRVSHNTIARVVGYPTWDQSRYMKGLTVTQIQKAISAYRLPYKIVFGRDYYSLMRTANTLGPVAVGMAYDWQPEKKGYVYLGRAADGYPNGFARNNGKTQLVGFRGAHLDLLLGYHVIRYPSGAVKERIIHIKDP